MPRTRRPYQPDYRGQLVTLVGAPDEPPISGQWSSILQPERSTTGSSAPQRTVGSALMCWPRPSAWNLRGCARTICSSRWRATSAGKPRSEYLMFARDTGTIPRGSSGSLRCIGPSFRSRRRVACSRSPGTDTMLGARADRRHARNRMPVYLPRSRPLTPAWMGRTGAARARMPHRARRRPRESRSGRMRGRAGRREPAP